MSSSAFDLLAQARWEAEGVRRARVRYEEAAAAKDPSALPSGQRLLREVVPALSTAIDRLKADGLERIGQKGKQPEWAFPIQLLDSKVAALITVSTALRAAEARGEDGVANVSRAIGLAYRDEVDYRRWMEAEGAKNKAAREAQDWEHADLLAALKRRYPQVDRKVWGRWKRKVDAPTTDWDNETLIHVGAALLRGLLDTAPDRFSMETYREQGKTTTRIALSAETQAIMKDVEERAAVARPRLMPMIIPPIAWKYAEGIIIGACKSHY